MKVNIQNAKDRKDVFEQDEREREEAARSECDNTIEGSDKCHQECGVWNFWCWFG